MDFSKPLQTQAYEHIKKRILSGEFVQDTLYSETKIAKELSISRTPLRDALRYLEQDGYITIVPSRGFRIRSLDEEGLRSSIELRSAIEGYCAFRAAGRCQEPAAAALVAGLEEIMGNMGRCVEDPDRVRDFINSDHAFHSRIIEFIGVEEFQAEFQKIYFLIRQTSERSLRVKGRSQKVFEEHQRILQSIRAGEPVKAYQEMIDHLRVPLHNLAP